MRLTTCYRLGLLLAVAVGGISALGQGASGDDGAVEPRTPVFQGSRAEAERFMAYHRAIRLTPEQEAIEREALEAIPAPCCSSFSAATCCCECNLARTIWGLSRFLIAKKGFGAARVRDGVNAWIRAINPSAFPGDACFTGGCRRPFEEGGCGGMREGQLEFR